MSALHTMIDDQLQAEFKRIANQISYHHADDSGREWGLATKLMPELRAVEVAIRDRGLPRPEGQYLLGRDDRINWETGEWSPGWSYKKGVVA